MRVQMEIKIEQRPASIAGADAAWYLYVNERLHVAGESYAMCDQVRAALEGAAWPCQEAHEIADVIRNSLNPSKRHAALLESAFDEDEDEETKVFDGQTCIQVNPSERTRKRAERWMNDSPSPARRKAGYWVKLYPLIYAYRETGGGAITFWRVLKNA